MPFGANCQASVSDYMDIVIDFPLMIAEAKCQQFASHSPISSFPISHFSFPRSYFYRTPDLGGQILSVSDQSAYGLVSCQDLDYMGTKQQYKKHVTVIPLAKGWGRRRVLKRDSKAI